LPDHNSTDTDTAATIAQAPRLAQSPRAARVAVIVVFLTHALLFASWTARIPQVKARLGLSDASLGLALFGAPVGSVAAMVVTGWLLLRLGSRRMVQLTLAGYCLTGLGVGLAGSQLQLFTALALWGVFQGSLDVSMNTQGISVERAVGRPIMSGFHGAWSIGGFTGAGLGALAVAAAVPLTGQLLTLGILAAVIAGLASTRLLPDPPHQQREHQERSGAVLRHPVVLILGAVALACMLCEGAAADWSAVYLHDSLRAAPALAGLGYAAFSATMVALRLTGDRLLARVPARTLLPVLAAISTLGLASALLLRIPVAALLGFAALGIGLALIVPAAFSAAGRLPGIPAGTAVAAVSALGWVGYVGGPVLIGHLAGLISLPVALALLPLLTAAIALATRATRAFSTPAEAFTGQR
jgi:predicted MFS family arabinose efflux permease